MTARDPRLVEPQRVGAGADAGTVGAYDPLRLCVLATVALLGWLLGPVALVAFAALGFVGYWRARRAGLMRSRCLLGDTRLVLAYLAALAVAGAAGSVWWLRGWTG
ncbi:MAG TPA: hypothetical protein VNT31_05930 [Nocardioides sp.]|nr:hypothetical protein [Nocardioides sp.]